MGVVRGVFVIRAELDSREFREAINRNFGRTPEWGAPEILRAFGARGQNVVMVASKLKKKTSA